VGADQKFHFEQVFSAAQILGYAKKNELKHVAHGLIRWEEGKFSTRKGSTIHLEEVLTEAVERAKGLISDDGQLSEGEKEEVAKAVGVGGIKFNDLKQEPERDIIFAWDKILNLQGYSAAYLQYTYTRCFSLLDKAKSGIASKIDYDLEKEEIDLLRSLYLFPEKIIISAEQFSPHFLAQYLFELSQKFNLFYQRCRIIDEKKEVESFRLFLTAATAEILNKGLGILGIQTLERM
jgi:arginyl-tRNA synthetase